jgi:AcrR family transcriptional regulator
MYPVPHERKMKAHRNNKKTIKAQEIIEATYAMILEHGYCNTSTQLIAQKAGITKSLLHYYFKNKDELMVATHNHAMQKLIETASEITLRYDDDPEKTSKRMILFWKMLKKNIDTISILYETSIYSLRNPEMRQKFGEFYAMMLDVVKNMIAKEHKHVNISSKDIEAIATIIIGGIESLIHHYMVDPKITDFDYSLKMLTRIVSNTLSASTNRV